MTNSKDAKEKEMVAAKEEGNGTGSPADIPGRDLSILRQEAGD